MRIVRCSDARLVKRCTDWRKVRACSCACVPTCSSEIMPFAWRLTFTGIQWGPCCLGVSCDPIDFDPNSTFELPCVGNCTWQTIVGFSHDKYGMGINCDFPGTEVTSQIYVALGISGALNNPQYSVQMGPLAGSTGRFFTENVTYPNSPCAVERILQNYQTCEQFLQCGWGGSVLMTPL